MPSKTIPLFVKEQLTELGIQDPDEPVQAADQALAISLLNRLIDTWNAQRQAVYNLAVKTFTFTADLSPHTIGPSGATFTTATTRPVSVEGANIVIDTNIRIPVRMRDAEWWRNQRLPEQGSSIPTDLYYEETWPNGRLYFWPVPNTAQGVDIQSRVRLAQVTAAGTLDLPPGYEDALGLTLQEKLGPAFRVRVMQETKDQAKKARAIVFSLNLETPRLVTADSGIPTTSGKLFRYRTGGLT